MLGDGGAIITNDKKIFSKVTLLRQYGWDDKRISKKPDIIQGLMKFKRLF